MTLKQAVEEYKEVYLAYRNYAPRTREEYTNDLEDMVEYLARVGVIYLKDVRLSNLIRYMAELDRRGLLGSTRKRKVVAIKSFFSFMYAESYTHTNIAREVIPPFVEESRPRYLTADEYNRLLDSAKGNIRDHAIILLLLQTGIRLSELTRLTLNDLRITDTKDENGGKTSFIRVIGGQRNKDRVVPINADAKLVLDEYLRDRDLSHSDNLFLSRSGEQLGERGVEKVVGKYLKLAGITNASVNSLRHTFGMQHVLKGTTIKTIQELMGHKDIRTTEEYIPLANGVAKSELEENTL